MSSYGPTGAVVEGNILFEEGLADSLVIGSGKLKFDTETDFKRPRSGSGHIYSFSCPTLQPIKAKINPHDHNFPSFPDGQQWPGEISTGHCCDLKMTSQALRLLSPSPKD
jgi:hypothetical protein